MPRLTLIARVLILVIALALVAYPVAAAPQPTPDTAEIDYFNIDECANVFNWQTSTEAAITGYRLEHRPTGWVSDFIPAANSGGNQPTVYAISGLQHIDLAGTYWLRVFFIGGSTMMNDVAERVCNWEP